MSWQQWILIGWIGVGALLTPLMVGRERKPIEPGTAVVMLVLAVLQMWLVVTS